MSRDPATSAPPFDGASGTDRTTKLLAVEDARSRMLAEVAAPSVETVALDEALGRTLAAPVVATRDQPPFDASAMDGWAVRSADLTSGEPTPLRIVGESAAGRGYASDLRPGEAVRISTGAPVPAGADRVVIQEEAERDGDHVRPAPRGAGAHIRLRGGDFRAGQRLLDRGVRLDPWRLSLAAAAGRDRLEVAARPRVAILTTGEELTRPGEAPGAWSIYDSASPALAALCRRWGADVKRLGPAQDRLEAVLALIEQAAADLIVTVGGASVGDHDLVRPAFESLGLELKVGSVRVRPGKPTWFGRLDDGRRVLGLPGNPASALVCAELFLRPLVMAMQGADPSLPLVELPLAEALPGNGPREHWMRARVTPGWQVQPFDDQDSSLVTVFADADALVRRPAGAAPAGAGALVSVRLLDRL